MVRRWTTVVLAAAFAAACGSAEPDPEAPAAAAPAAEEVVLTNAKRQTGGVESVVTATESWPGRLDAPAVLKLDDRRTARIGSLVDAVVSDVVKDVGDTVGQGALLATLHTHLTHDAWADHRKAQAEVKRLTSDLAFARRASERNKRLLADKAIAAQEVERAEVEVRAIEQQLAAAEAESLRTVEELEHLGIDPDAVSSPGVDHDRVPVRTPQRGRIIERLVTPGSTVTPGQPLFVVSDLSTLWAVAEVDEAHLAALNAGTRVELGVAAYPDETFPATILAIGDMIDPQSRRVRVRCEVPNADGRLKPEMFAAVRLATTAAPAIVVPADAVQRSANGTVVFVEVEPGRFKPRDVRIGPVRDGRVALLDGVRVGERVVTKGAFLLKSELRQGAGESE